MRLLLGMGLRRFRLIRPQFFKIIEGREQAQVVYETQDTLAFFPLQPAAVGHTLIVPKVHVRDIWSLDSELAEHQERLSSASDFGLTP
jgi:diadenosine tetraphosphate (Ap4A) HIT family hydrolase